MRKGANANMLHYGGTPLQIAIALDIEEMALDVVEAICPPFPTPQPDFTLQSSQHVLAAMLIAARKGHA